MIKLSRFATSDLSSQQSRLQFLQAANSLLDKTIRPTIVRQSFPSKYAQDPRIFAALYPSRTAITCHNSSGWHLPTFTVGTLLQSFYITVMNDISVGMNDYWLVLHKTVITTKAATAVNKATAINKTTAVAGVSRAPALATFRDLLCSGACYAAFLSQIHFFKCVVINTVDLFLPALLYLSICKKSTSLISSLLESI